MELKNIKYYILTLIFFINSNNLLGSYWQNLLSCFSKKKEISTATATAEEIFNVMLLNKWYQKWNSSKGYQVSKNGEEYYSNEDIEKQQVEKELDKLKKIHGFEDTSFITIPVFRDNKTTLNSNSLLTIDQKKEIAKKRIQNFSTQPLNVSQETPPNKTLQDLEKTYRKKNNGWLCQLRKNEYNKNEYNKNEYNKNEYNNNILNRVGKITIASGKQLDDPDAIKKLFDRLS